MGTGWSRGAAALWDVADSLSGLQCENFVECDGALLWARVGDWIPVKNWMAENLGYSRFDKYPEATVWAGRVVVITVLSVQLTGRKISTGMRPINVSSKDPTQIKQPSFDQLCPDTLN